MNTTEIITRLIYVLWKRLLAAFFVLDQYYCKTKLTGQVYLAHSKDCCMATATSSLQEPFSSAAESLLYMYNHNDSELLSVK